MAARYIGIPDYDSDDNVFFSLLEYQHRLFRIILQEDLICPTLLDFPLVPDGYQLEEIHVTPEMDEVLRTSVIIMSGSDAMVRAPASDSNCVIKCALPFQHSRARVEHEYRMLKNIEELSVDLPVVRTRGKVMEDCHGVFAFWLESLQEWDDNADLTGAIRDVTAALHKQGICHNDLRRPNIMRRGLSPILIDFDRAGFIGDKVPSYINSTSRTYTVNEDIVAVGSFRRLTLLDVVFSRFYNFKWRIKRRMDIDRSG